MWDFEVSAQQMAQVLQTDGNQVRAVNADGRWPFASGAHHCDWLAGVAVIDGAPAPEARLVVMPRAGIDLLDTWHFAGPKGTGSTDFEARHTIVPERHTTPLNALKTWPAGRSSGHTPLP